MTTSTRRSALGRGTGAALAGLAILATVQGAAASDGLGGFLESIFGGGGQQAAAPAPAPAPAPVYERSIRRRPAPRRAAFHARPSFQRPLVVRLQPLVVRLHKAAAPRVVVAQMPAKPGPVSIFEDRTLKRGDAVMTDHGIRVFAGSASWPYTSADFVALSAAKDMSKDTAKVLAGVDSLPRI